MQINCRCRWFKSFFWMNREWNVTEDLFEMHSIVDLRAREYTTVYMIKASIILFQQFSSVHWPRVILYSLDSGTEPTFFFFVYLSVFYINTPVLRPKINTIQ